MLQPFEHMIFLRFLLGSKGSTGLRILLGRWSLTDLACVASVPVRSERNSGRAKESFGREKWGQSKTVEGRGWGRGKKGTLARKPLDFEKRPLVFTVEFIY